MTFSASESVYKIMLLYLQPFELAMLTGEHSDSTYLNAVANGSTEYVTSQFCTDLDNALYVAADNSQHDVIHALIDLGATNLNLALFRAIVFGKLETIELFIYLGADALDKALMVAAAAGNCPAIKLLAIGKCEIDEAINTAIFNGRNDATALLINLKNRRVVVR